MTKFWKGILSSQDTTSSKRLITLVIAGHFIMASFIILFLVLYEAFFTSKGTINPSLIDLLKDILEKDFYIILVGLGFITSENLVSIMADKAKAIAVTKADDCKPDNPDKP